MKSTYPECPLGLQLAALPGVHAQSASLLPLGRKYVAFFEQHEPERVDVGETHLSKLGSGP